MTYNPYPLGETELEKILSAGNRPLNEVNMEFLRSNLLNSEDIRIHVNTLLRQAEIANQAGFPRLAENLTRAAELTRVPNEQLLHMYEALRPGRSTEEELLSIARLLEEKFDAPHNAKLFREAAAVYRDRKLLPKNPQKRKSRSAQ